MLRVVVQKESEGRACMSSKNKTQVIIAGKIYTLSGYESEEYLQRVAAYLNSKITEFKNMEDRKSVV